MTIIVVDHASTPAVPATGYHSIYPKADGWYGLDHNGNEVQFADAAAVDTAIAGTLGLILPFSVYNNSATNTTYYVGGLHGGAWGTTGGGRRIYFPAAGIVTKAKMVITFGASPTSENWTISFRLNDTTDTTIDSAVDISTGSPKIVSKTDLNISISGDTDYYEMKIAVPSMSTYPTAVSISGWVYMVMA